MNENPLSEPVSDVSDLEFMRSPSLWPNWPYQTLKHSTERQPSGFPRLAVLIDTMLQYPSGKPIVRFKECNLWAITSGAKALEGSIEADFADLVREGWVVD